MRALVALLAIASLGAGCRQWPDYAGAFDLPQAMAVLQPEVGGPFTEPVGFVANLHGGQIAALALKQGRMLADQASVAFLRGNQIAVGQERVIGGLAVALDGDRIDLLVGDRRFEQIVQVPYSVGVDALGAPIRPETTVDQPRFDDADGSGDAATLEGLEVKTGWTATEDWTVTFDGAQWEVVGSRSGRMRDPAFTDEPYIGVRRAVAFTIRGTATAGDRFTFRTDSGALEHEAGGRPLEMRSSPDLSRVAVVLAGPDGQAALKVFDAGDPGSLASSPALAVGQPGRLAWSEDGTRLFASDSTRGAWEIDVEAGTTRFLDLPFPTMDVAHLAGPDGDRLWVAAADQKEVHVLDLTTGEPLDLNPWVPGAQGMAIDAPVTGIEAMHIPYLQLEQTDAGVRKFGRSVAIAAASGRVLFSSERDGCLVADPLGPRSSNSSSFGFTSVDYTTSFDREFPFGPYLERNAHNARHVMPNPCAGVTRGQSWAMRFDQIEQGWRVEGSLSGVQTALAYEDQRYVSDDGEVSFTIRSGATGSRDGWLIRFTMIDGLSSADGDNDGNPATREVTLDHPGDPIYYHYTVGRTDQGWRPVDRRPFVLLAGEASDRVGRVMPQEALIDASWE